MFTDWVFNRSAFLTGAGACSGGFAAFGALSSSQSSAAAAPPAAASTGVATSNLFGQPSTAASSGPFQAFAAPASPGAGLFGQPAAATAPPFGGTPAEFFTTIVTAVAAGTPAEWFSSSGQSSWCTRCSRFRVGIWGV